MMPNFCSRFTTSRQCRGRLTGRRPGGCSRWRTRSRSLRTLSLSRSSASTMTLRGALCRSQQGWTGRGNLEKTKLTKFFKRFPLLRKILDDENFCLILIHNCESKEGIAASSEVLSCLRKLSAGLDIVRTARLNQIISLHKMSKEYDQDQCEE